MQAQEARSSLVGRYLTGTLTPRRALSAVLDTTMEKKPAFFVLKDSGTDTYSADTDRLFAIHKNCENKELAFEIAQVL